MRYITLKPCRYVGSDWPANVEFDEDSTNPALESLLVESSVCKKDDLPVVPPEPQSSSESTESIQTSLDEATGDAE